MASLDNLHEKLKNVANLDFTFIPREPYQDANEYKYLTFHVGLHGNSGKLGRSFKSREDALKFAKKEMRRKSQVVTTTSYYWTCPAFY